MKARYSSPKLNVYGSVDSLTQVYGSLPTKDGLFINGVPQDVDGSGSISINTNP
jgi:hypothetical protein